MNKCSVIFIILLTVLFLIAGCSKPASEPVEPPKIEPSEIESPEVEPPILETKPTVSFHDNSAEILRNYVSKEGLVDYKTLKRKRFDLKKLLDQFDNLEPDIYSSWAKEDKIAFWLNAYNIQMLKIIVDNYPIQSSRIYRLFWPPNSIRHIKDIWSKYKFMVMDEEFTLAEIEKRFFRQEFDEPRIFFALSRASLSSPPLRNEPYYGHKLLEQLDEQANRFLSSPQGFQIDRNSRTVYLSAILQPTWFGREFISKYGTDKKFKDQQPSLRAVLNFIINYIPEEDISFLEVENYTIEYIKYDWTLNDGS